MKLSLLIITWVMLLTVATAVAGENIAVVKQVEGTVKVKRAGEMFEVAQSDRLLVGDLLMTGSDGRIGIIFHDGSILSLAEQSFLRLKAFQFKPLEKQFDFKLNLEKGSALFQSGKIGTLAPERFSLELPQGTIGIRGTRFLVEVR